MSTNITPLPTTSISTMSFKELQKSTKEKEAKEAKALIEEIGNNELFGKTLRKWSIAHLKTIAIKNKIDIKGKKSNKAKLFKCLYDNKDTLEEPTNEEFSKRYGEENDKKVVIQDTKKTFGDHLDPLFKWSGGKSDEIKIIEKLLPKNYEVYIEPFVGGGSLFFHLNFKQNVIADVHYEIINFYNMLQNGYGSKMYDELRKCDFSEREYYKIRDNLSKDETPVNDAFRFIYLRKTCFRGMSRYSGKGENIKFNIPYGRYKSVNFTNLIEPKYLQLLDKERTRIHLTSFEHIFAEYDDERYFMFLDPPYDSTFTNYGYCEFGKDEHKKLADLFKKSKCKLLMIIGGTSMIKEFYEGYIRGYYEKKYRFKIYDDRVKKDAVDVKHLIISNYPIENISKIENVKEYDEKHDGNLFHDGQDVEKLESKQRVMETD